MNATTIALATIATRWRLQPLPGARVRPSINGPALSPGGLRMRVLARATTGTTSHRQGETRAGTTHPVNGEQRQ